MIPTISPEPIHGTSLRCRNLPIFAVTPASGPDLDRSAWKVRSRPMVVRASATIAAAAPPKVVSSTRRLPAPPPLLLAAFGAVATAPHTW